VYPPVSQAVFGLGSGLFPGSARGFVVVVRLVLLAAEAATALLLLALLRHFGQPPQRAFLYLLNPLVIVELTGNLHFEALAICFLLAAAWALTRGRAALSAGLLALSAATKLLPLLLLPLLLRRLAWGCCFCRFCRPPW
jgi:alpha-1,6-mannosyltransferase